MDDDELLALSDLGFSISLDESSVSRAAVVQCVPDILAKASPSETLSAIMSLSRGITTIDDAAANLACRSAIKNGTIVSRMQMQNIVSGLMRCVVRDVCPHGRPTFLELGQSDLAAIFRRRYVPQCKKTTKGRRVSGQLTEGN
jgi:DNA mismatch repair ATPase MutL